MSDLLLQLSRELGRDAVLEANLRHPELQTLSDEQVAQLVGEIDYVMQSQQWPRTIESAERAYRVLEALGELGKITGGQSAPEPEAFIEKPDEDEFCRAAPIAEVAEYLKAKYPTG